MRIPNLRSLGLSLLIALGGITPVAAEEATINAFSAWIGDGELFPTGPDHAVFIGSLRGRIYVETEKGPIDAGLLICPAMVDLNLKTGVQRANAQCSVRSDDGARVFGTLTCLGLHLIGCDGEFEITSGTDRFDGITGGGPVTIRSDLRALAVDLDSRRAVEAGTGTLVFRDFHYKIP